MLKVLMCGNHPSNKGGMTSVIIQILAKKWDEDGIALSFIPTYLPGGKIKTIAFFGISYLRLLGKFIFNRPDVFYTHMSVRGSFTRTKALHRLCKKFGVPDVIHLHGSEFKDWYESESNEKKKEIKTIIEECNAFIVLGQKWEEYVSSIAPAARIHQIHNCIAIPKATVSWKTPFEYLYLGVLIPRKGVIDLLKAIKSLHDRGESENCIFSIGGTGTEEEYLKRYVIENGLDKEVHFLGWITGDEKDRVIMNSNALVLPSYNEGLPVAILEAMSYGLPVISTDVGDITDAVKEDENGYLISPGDVDSLADRLVKVKEEDIWKRLSKDARRIAEEQFDIGQFYKQLEQVWKSVAK